jgi:gliding motility-associated-like protein
LITATDTTTINSTQQFVQNIALSGTETLNIQGQYINAFDNCPTVLETVTPRASTYGLTAEQLTVTPQCDRSTQLKFNYLPDPGQLYQIEIEDQSAILPFLDRLTSGQLIVDSVRFNIDATEFCIRIISLSACDSLSTGERLFCQPRTDNTQLSAAGYASFDDQQIRLTWLADTTVTATIIKYADNIILDSFLNVTSPFLDGSVSERRIISYEMLLEDPCGESIQEERLSPPFIRMIPDQPNRYSIDYIEPQFFGLTIDNPLGELLVAGTNNSARFLNDQPSSLGLTSALGKEQSVLWRQQSDSIVLNSNTVNLDYRYVVNIPSAFTPNNDGLNDRIELYGLPTDADFEMAIFNKWGEQIHTSSRINELWDGKLSNGKIIEGVYVYQLIFTLSGGELFKQEGSFVLIQK